MAEGLGQSAAWDGTLPLVVKRGPNPLLAITAIIGLVQGLGVAAVWAGLVPGLDVFALGTDSPFMGQTIVIQTAAWSTLMLLLLAAARLRYHYAVDRSAVRARWRGLVGGADWREPLGNYAGVTIDRRRRFVVLLKHRRKSRRNVRLFMLDHPGEAERLRDEVARRLGVPAIMADGRGGGR